MTVMKKMARSGAASPHENLQAALEFQSRNRAIQHEINDLLVYEAWLLDNDQLTDWLTLIADDVNYVAPVRRKVAVENLTLASLDDDTVHVSTFNDGKAELGFRVARMNTGHDHYNKPSALHRRLVGNVLLLDYDAAGGLVTVTSNCFIFRAREDKEETLFVCARDDVWRHVDTGWQLVRRLIRMDHHMLPPVSVFF